MIKDEFDQLLVDQLWTAITGGKPWTPEQIEENRVLERYCKFFLEGQEDYGQYKFIQDEAFDLGLTTRQFCEHVISKGLEYRRIVSATWRARQMLARFLETNPETEQDQVADLIENTIGEIISKYVTFDQA